MFKVYKNNMLLIENRECKRQVIRCVYVDKIGFRKYANLDKKGFKIFWVHEIELHVQDIFVH